MRILGHSLQFNPIVLGVQAVLGVLVPVLPLGVLAHTGEPGLPVARHCWVVLRAAIPEGSILGQGHAYYAVHLTGEGVSSELCFEFGEAVTFGGASIFAPHWVEVPCGKQCPSRPCQSWLPIPSISLAEVKGLVERRPVTYDLINYNCKFFAYSLAMDLVPELTDRVAEDLDPEPTDPGQLNAVGVKRLVGVNWKSMAAFRKVARWQQHCDWPDTLIRWYSDLDRGECMF
jgi:hypothetical protein